MTRLRHFFDYWNLGMDVRNAWRLSADPRKKSTVLNIFKFVRYALNRFSTH